MKKISVIGATLLGATVLCAAPISLHLSQDKGMSLSVDKAQAVSGDRYHPGALLASTADMRGVHIAVDLMAKAILAAAAITARRRDISLLVHPVRRRQSSHSRRIRRPATPSSVSASNPGRPRRRPPSIISRSRLQRNGEGTRSVPSPVLRAEGRGSSPAIKSGRPPGS